jgi:hypothetical protein
MQASELNYRRSEAGDVTWKSMAAILMAAGMAAATAGSTPCLAQVRRPGAAPRQQNKQLAGQHHVGDWLRKYKDLPPDQQQKALENDPDFIKLPPFRQQILRQRLQHFSSLPPQQQERILNRMETWEHLTPEQKQHARELFQQFQQLPPDRRRMVQTAVQNLRQMPPEQRQQILDSDRFKSMFSPDERNILKGAAELPLAPAENNQPEATPEQ